MKLRSLLALWMAVAVLLGTLPAAALAEEEMIIEAAEDVAGEVVEGVLGETGGESEPQPVEADEVVFSDDGGDDLPGGEAEPEEEGSLSEEANPDEAPEAGAEGAEDAPEVLAAAEDGEASEDPDLYAPLWDVDDIIDGVRSGSEAGMIMAPAGSYSKADIVFVIDSTGSMSQEINNVKNNLNKFTAILDEAGVDYRIAVMEYKDCKVDGENSTRILSGPEGKWFTSATSVASVMSEIQAKNKGDDESLVDALGLMLSGELVFRSDASKFAMVLTDENYATYNHYGYTSMTQVIDRLVDVGVCTSVIASNSLQSTYNALYSRTDGLFCDIYNSDFASELIKLAEYLKKVAKPVEIRLFTEEMGYSGYNARRKLIAEFNEPENSEADVTNMTVTLTLPEGVTLGEGETLAKMIPVVKRGNREAAEPERLSWEVSVPVGEDSANYTWSVSCRSDDFAVGAVPSAQDTFSVVGTNMQFDWDFEKDSYPFGNNFGSGKQYYVSDEDFKAFVYALSKQDLWLIGVSNGRGEEETPDQEKYDNFLNHQLQTWSGSCYGMSLTAALFKAGIMSPGDYGGKLTRDLQLNKVESMINIYQMSQDAGVSSRGYMMRNGTEFSGVLYEMFQKGQNIGWEKSGQQPFLVYLRYEAEGEKPYAHAVVCYDARQGMYSDNGSEYNFRLKIADPNKSGPEYIYIADDFSRATYTGSREYNCFGYYASTLSELNGYAFADVKRNYSIKLKVDRKTALQISSPNGSAIFRDGLLVQTRGSFPVQQGLFARGGSTDNFYYIDDSSDAYTLTPLDASGQPAAGEIKATLSFDGYLASIDGDARQVTASKDGQLSFDNATQALSVSLVSNGSAFDAATISGQASGDVSVQIGGDAIGIKGNLSGYTVSNTDRNAQVSNVAVNVDGDAQAKLESGKVAVYVDRDASGDYEFRLDGEIGLPIDEAHFPDAAFRAHLLKECDLNRDGGLSDSERLAVTDLRVWEAGIASLKGIEQFPNLEHLDCVDNRLTELDLSGNPGLKSLYCSKNALQRLDLSANATLAEHMRTDGPIKRDGAISFVPANAWDDVDPNLILDAEVTVVAKGNTLYAPGAVIEREAPSITLGVKEKSDAFHGEPTDGSKYPYWITQMRAHKCSFETADGKVAKIDAKGVVTGVKAGKTWVRMLDGSIEVRCEVNVKKAPSKVSLSKKKMTLQTGDTRALSAKLPSGTASRKLTWKSSNSKIASYDPWSGKVEALKAGTATITVKTFNGKKASCKVKVVAPQPTMLDLGVTTLTLRVGEDFRLLPVIDEGLTTKFSYSTKNKRVAKVNSKGVITGVKKGTTTIIVKTGNGLKKSVKVKVTGKPKAQGTYVSGTSGIHVYCTASDPCFHNRSDCSGLADPSRITLETALNYGKTPCPVCLATANQTVYAQEGSVYFHYKKNHAGSKAKSCTLAAARAMGMTACPLCKPD